MGRLAGGQTAGSLVDKPDPSRLEAEVMPGKSAAGWGRGRVTCRPVIWTDSGRALRRRNHPVGVMRTPAGRASLAACLSRCLLCSVSI
jgi:hypothetical protein